MEIIGRVIKRLRYGGASLVLFVAVWEKNGTSYQIVQCILSTSVGHVDFEEVRRWRSAVHTGDAVRVVGTTENGTHVEGEANKSTHSFDIAVNRSKADSAPKLIKLFVTSVAILEHFATVHKGCTFQWNPVPSKVNFESSWPCVELVLQSSGDHVARLAEYCHEISCNVLCGVAAPLHGVEHRAILVRSFTDDGHIRLLRDLAGDSIVEGALQRAFLVGRSPFLTLEAALVHARSLVENCTLRVKTFPKHLEELVLEGLVGARFNPTGFNFILSVVYADGQFYIGLAKSTDHCCEHGAESLDSRTPRTADRRAKHGSLSLQGNLESVCSRSFFKLREVLARGGSRTAKWETEIFTMPLRCAIDVGAAPGGWSTCLASLWNCQEIHAIDPGELAHGLNSSIRQYRKQWHDAFADLVVSGVVADVLVSDMNCSASQALEPLLLAAKKGLLRQNAFVVVTLKNRERAGRQDWETLVARLVQCMRHLCPDALDMHLLANTNHETTLLGRYSPTALTPDFEATPV